MWIVQVYYVVRTYLGYNVDVVNMTYMDVCETVRRWYVIEKSEG